MTLFYFGGQKDILMDYSFIKERITEVALDIRIYLNLNAIQNVTCHSVHSL